MGIDDVLLKKLHEDYDSLSHAANMFRDLLQNEFAKMNDSKEKDYYISLFNKMITSAINVYSEHAFICKTSNESSLLHAVTCKLLAQVEDDIVRIIKSWQKYNKGAK